MQDPMQSPGPQPGPYPGQFPGQFPGQNPGPYPGPMPGQYPGPMPGQYPGGGGGGGGGMGGLNFRDPATLLRIVVIALGALCVILLIAGTAVDEYTGTSHSLGSVWFGCQKNVRRPQYEKGTSVSLPFKYMNILSFIIIFTTSVLCILQAAATGLNVVVLLQGKLQKVALIVSTVVTVLLLLVIIMANINFSGRRYGSQVNGFHVLEMEKYKEKYSRMKRSIDDEAMTHLDTWGSSYGLICSAFAFALINQILLILILKLSSAGGSTGFGAFVKTLAQDFGRNPAKGVRMVIFLINVLLLALMLIGVVLDSYIDGGVSSPCLIGVINNGCNGHLTAKDGLTILEMKPEEQKKIMEDNVAQMAPAFMNAHALAIVLFALTILICILLAVATAMCVVRMVMESTDKILTFPLLGISGGSSFFLLISVILACVEFKAANHKENIPGGTVSLEAHKKYSDGPSLKDLSKADPTLSVSFAVSFNILATSLAFGLVNTGLNALNIFVLDKRGSGTGGTTSNLNVSSTQPSSSGPVPPPLAPMGLAPTA